MKDLNLRKAFPIVAAALGNKLGINVMVTGTQACTNGDEIHLPSYDGDDPGYKAVAWGFLAHEAAHIRYTDFSICARVTDKFRFSVLNVLEDIRIEMLINHLYPGTRFTIEKMVLHIIQTGDFHALTQEAHPAAILHDYMLYHLRCVCLNQTALNALAEQADSILESTFPVGMVTRLAGLLSEVPHLASTWDALALTDRILAMLQEEEENERQRQQKQSSGQGGSDSQPHDANDSDGQPDDADPDETGDRPKHSGDESSPDGSDDEAGQDGQGDQPNGTGGDSAQDDSADANPPNGCGNANQGGPSGSALSKLLQAEEDDIPDDIMETARQILEIADKEASDMTFPAPQKPEAGQSGSGLLAKVETETGRLRSAMQGIIQSERMNRPVYKDSGRRLDSRRLHRLFSNDARVFQRKTHQESPNTAIHLLLDRSPSTAKAIAQGVKLFDIAAEATLALSLSLEGMPGVNPGITAFPGHNGSPSHVIEILGHGQRVRPNVGNFAVPVSVYGSTPMTEAIWFCASGLMACKESRKVLVVLTDGEPDDDIGTLDILKRCRASGIEDIGIGIGVDVKHLFTTALLINDVRELRAKLFQISKELLLAA
jgi:cobaltochelatase CobT